MTTLSKILFFAGAIVSGFGYLYWKNSYPPLYYRFALSGKMRGETHQWGSILVAKPQQNKTIIVGSGWGRPHVLVAGEGVQIAGKDEMIFMLLSNGTGSANRYQNDLIEDLFGVLGKSKGFTDKKTRNIWQDDWRGLVESSRKVSLPPGRYPKFVRIREADGKWHADKIDAEQLDALGIKVEEVTLEVVRKPPPGSNPWDLPASAIEAAKLQAKVGYSHFRLAGKLQ